jgi:hypothetical protein
LLFGCIYKSPGAGQEDIKNGEELNRLMRKIGEMKREQVVITGDFNMRTIDWTNWKATNQLERDFLIACTDAYLCQNVLEPTRGRQGQQPSLLDLILTTADDSVHDIKYHSPLGASDHASLLFEYRCPVTKELVNKTVILYAKGDYQSMNAELGNIQWRDEIDRQDIAASYEKLRDIVTSATKKYIPQKKFAAGERRKTPGVTGEVAKLIKKKNRAWTRYMETRCPTKYKEYTRLRNKAKYSTKKAIRAHERKIASTAKENPKTFWSYVNRRTKNKEKIPDLYVNDDVEQLAKTKEEKANLLNDYFASVFTKEPNDTIPEPRDRDFREELITVNFTEEEVGKKLRSLNPGKSPGPDSMHPRILKETANRISRPLCMIFESSMETGVLPATWKTAHVTALFKKGNKHKPENYRPVSLTSVVCKVMEHFIREAIIQHMDSNNLFTDCQFGFRQKRSTTLQLLLAVEEWTAYMDEGLPVDAFYLDLRKAFDTVPHRRLLTKLHAYGIRGNLLRWIEGFLSGRTQQVMVGGSKSEQVPVESGVPQGSVLGPTLFIIYINDLPEQVRSRLLLYADDSKLYRAIREEQDHATLQEDISALQDWSDRWLLAFHPDKCHVMTLGGRSQETDHEYRMRAPNGQVTMERSTLEKDLGVLVDCKLTFGDEVASRAKKGRQIAAIIRRTFTYLDEKMFAQLFKALVRPHLEYAVAVWSPYLRKNIKELEDVQRRATRQIPSLKGLDYGERLKRLRLPTLEQRRRRGDMVEVFKILSGCYDIDSAKFFAKTQNHRTRGHTLKLEKTRSRTMQRQQVFSQRVVNDWNALPEEVVTAPSLNCFKSRLDKFWAESASAHNRN